MNVMEWVKISLADLDPAISTAIGSITAAISMAIITIVSYYFPKDHSKFDEYEYERESPKRKRRRSKKDQVIVKDGDADDD